MAQKQRQAGRSSLRTFYIVLGVIAIAGIAWLTWSLANRDGEAATAPVTLQNVDDPRALLAQAQGMALGESSAPVQVFEFADYQCPACGVFNNQIKTLVLQPYVESGRVQFVYYDFPLGGAHIHAFLAARAARCAGEQDRFWQYQDAIYRNQNEWSSRRSALDDFLRYGRDLGLGPDFDQCVRSDRFADVVTANRLLGDQLGVSATPTIFVNGVKVRDPLDPNGVKAAIDQALGL